jgi:hypothetical protein
MNSVKYFRGLAFAAVVVLIAALGFSTAVAFAYQPVRTAPVQQGLEQRRQQSQPGVDERSKRIQERIALIIARFNELKDRHVAVYERIKEQVRKIIATLLAKGYDTGKLAQDLQSLDAMVVKAGQDYATFIEKLTAAQQYVPLESQGQFLTAIEDNRAQLRLFRSDLLDARNFYWTVIRPDINALKSQKPATQSAPSTTPTPAPTSVPSPI